ncbi:hypothetical protein PGO_126090 [Plasmodium gonderi]|uniref:Uncharacterized protein n=1 Tax=Plasmodium gonderi TaxID=77519 RepID=A0A1Y1JJI3_PLAGO|nr:hypothetical protein PGO_126090 [Plasmodium gonderi]GAW82611.1 hypothetical protein PGO_126090 [Plasmodium gonderi]
MKQIILFILAIFICHTHHNVGLCQMCTNDICRRCCHPTKNGCENNFHKTIRGNYHSDSVYCSMCDCSNPSIGCGWVGDKYGEVMCTSCSFINHASVKIKYFDIVGCGHKMKRGNLLSST